jgi:hypothetical protein
MDAPRELVERVAQNEVVFRNANESLKRVFAGSAAPSAEVYPFLCECGNRSCTDVVQVPLDVYESIREHPARFLHLTGHGEPGVENVVEEGDGYEIVEKWGRAGAIARAKWELTEQP